MKKILIKLFGVKWYCKHFYHDWAWYDSLSSKRICKRCGLGQKRVSTGKLATGTIDTWDLYRWINEPTNTSN